MSNTIQSPNMNLPIPVVGVDIGPDYALNVDACLGIVDGHNHAAGSGVQINTAGININSDLPMNINNLILARSVRFSPQSSPISGGSDIGCIYESGVDLWYNDGSGNQVRLTASGAVAGSPGSISGLTSPASASYNLGSQTFVWQSAASTAANMDAGSYIFRNITANSHGVTLSAPAALGSDYSLVLPQIPAQTNLMTLDSSGNMSSITYSTLFNTLSWQNWTPTITTGAAMATTLITARYIVIGPLLHFYLTFTINSITASQTFLNFTLPITAIDNGANSGDSIGQGFSGGLTALVVSTATGSNPLGLINFFNTGLTFSAAQIQISGFYEIA